MRNEPGALSRIKTLCNSHNLEYGNVFTKAKLLLTNYYCIIWAAKHTETDKKGVKLYADGGTEAGLLYLAVLDAAEDKIRFQENMCRFADAAWLVEIMQSAMSRIAVYPVNGAIYHDILAGCFLSDELMSDRVAQNTVMLERSTYYERKKEAVLLLGVILWGIEIPKMLKFLHLEGSAEKKPHVRVAETTCRQSNKFRTDSGLIED